MKYLLVILFSPFLSCSTKESSEFKNLKYSAYTWHLGKDSIEFYLAYYIEVKEGKYMAMKQLDFTGKPEFYRGTVSDSIQKLLNTLLKNNTFTKTYFFDSSSKRMYDGFYYLLDVIDDREKRKIIQFVPERSPSQLEMLGSILETLSSPSTGKISPPFSIASYKEEIKTIAKEYGPPIPQARKLPTIQHK